ncbi:hypothetical protein RJT34_23441 [Clitoria ternatea]|uniref:Uncharacterized protein n=1 Tax=Clitoria ternatea TaxID=43366 RepID=A0AAN9FST5_CLITE
MEMKLQNAFARFAPFLCIFTVSMFLVYVNNRNGVVGSNHGQVKSKYISPYQCDVVIESERTVKVCSDGMVVSFVFLASSKFITL